MDLTDLSTHFDIPSGPAFDVTPEKAVEYFKAKGLKPTFAWQDMLGAEHDHAFTVAKMMDVDLLADVHASLVKSLEDGVPFREWADNLIPTLQAKGWWGRKPVVDPLTGQTIVADLGTPSRLQTIFRTNLQAAYAKGQWDLIEAQAQDAPYLMYDAIDDGRTRPAHHAWDGTVLPITSKWWRTHTPPCGWNCFPPDQVVSGNFDVGLKAWYSGALVELTTRKGNRLTVTANHPVLTDHGWVAAGDLREGDRLLAYCGDVEHLRIRGVDHQQGPMAAQDAFETIAAQGVPAATVKATFPLDLYGDAALGDGYIHVVGTDRVLRISQESGGDQGGQNGHLSVADSLGHAGVAGSGTSRQFPEASLPAPAGIPGGGALPLDRGAVGTGPLDPLLLGSGAEGDATIEQVSRERWSAHEGLLRKAVDAFSGEVALDELVAIRRFDWSGHVYDFQTDSGFILASCIVTSNCRCSVIQLDDADLERLGVQVNERPPPSQTYEWTNPRTGQVFQIPKGVDPGFGTAAADRVDNIEKLLAEKVAALPPALAPFAAAGVQANLEEQVKSANLNLAKAEGAARASQAEVKLAKLGAELEIQNAQADKVPYLAKALKDLIVSGKAGDLGPVETLKQAKAAAAKAKQSAGLAEFKKAILQAFLAKIEQAKAVEAPPPAPELTPPAGVTFTPEEAKKVLEQSVGSFAAGMNVPERPGGKAFADVPLEHKRAIVAYTGSHYRTVNRALREGSASPETMRYAELLNEALSLSPKYQGEVTRGITLLGDELKQFVADHQKALVTGETVVHKGFISTSKGERAAFNGNVILHIDAKHGVYVRPLSLHPGENEVLLRHQARFNVRDVKQEGGTWHLYLSEV